MGSSKRLTHQASSIRGDHIGSSGHGYHHSRSGGNVESITYGYDDSDVYRAAESSSHYAHRGKFWNQGKHATAMLYILIAAIGVVQAVVAYFANILSKYFIESKYTYANNLLAEGQTFRAFIFFVFIQAVFAAIASFMVYLEPVAGGSGIPEVKCYLNGIDLPRVGAPLTLLCKVLGVICSVSAGLPVGKEGPMVHSGTVVATTLSSGKVRNDRQKRDLVACGAAAGVTTAFSAPIGGILFSLEEGASFWAPSQTWRTFFCCMVAFMTLFLLNTVGSHFGKVGFSKLFSFGNFVFEEGGQSSYYAYELFVFIAIGMIGGVIGAVFNNTNERITKWRIKNVNYSKEKRVVEVICVSCFVSAVSFVLPLCWGCRPLPSREGMDEQQRDLLDELVPFLCKTETEYNEVASLIFTEASTAIRQLFHLHGHAFSGPALFAFFICYISLAVLVYGIAVPSGLFVPSLLSGAVFGRFFGNLAHKLYPQLALSNTYALIGAAAVLGGMARMTISLTVILLECTGNEQFVLPLMLTLMTARIIGGLFNEDLYHIHIHMKKGVHLLEAELKSVTRHDNLTASDIMGENVIFVRPVEKVGIVYDILRASTHSTFAIVDKNDKDVLYGTIGRNALTMLLQYREFGMPQRATHSVAQAHYLQVDGDKSLYLPLIQWETVEKASSKLPDVKDLRCNEEDREFLVDLRPYANTAPITVHEFSTVQRTYDLFRSLGLRFLPVVNRYNQVVGTITRADLTPDALADAMLSKGKKHV